MPVRAGDAMWIKFEDRSLRKLLKSNDKIVRQAFGSSINRAVRTELAKMYRSTAAKAKVPQNTIRRRTKVYKANRRKPYVIIHAITWPVNPHSLTNARKVAGGVKAGGKAGKHFFPGAFIGKSPTTGKLKVYRRQPGASRLPVDIVGVEVHDIINEGVRKLSNRAVSIAVKKHLPNEIKQRMAGTIGRGRRR